MTNTAARTATGLLALCDSQIVRSGAGSVAAGLSVFLACASAFALDDDRVWVDHTYDKWIIGMAPADNVLLIATHGGGVIAWDTLEDTYIKHTRNGNGLPSNFLAGVAFDAAAGDVWAATERGLARLPGGFTSEQWQIIHQPGSGPLDGMLMTSVAVDHEGVVWAGSYNDGLFRFDGKAWTQYLPWNSGLSDVFVTSLAVGPKNELWVGAWGDGVDLFHNDDWMNFRPSNTGTPSGCSEILAMEPTSLGLVSHFVDVLGVHPVTGETWFLNDDDGFCLLEGATRFDGNLAIESADEASAWSTFTVQNSALPSNTVTSAGFDSAGTSWIGTVSGVVRYGDGDVHWELPSLESVLAIQEVGGDLWFGTYEGFEKYDGSSLTAHQTDGLADNFVADVAESPNGDIWIATRGGAQRYLGDGRWSTFTTADGLPINDVRVIEFDADGTMYLGTHGGGLAVYDGESVQVLTPANSDICCMHISELAITSTGEIWAGSFLGNNVWSLGIAPGGDIWQGSTNGVTRFSDSGSTHFTIADGLPNNVVQAIAFEPDGAVWVGTLAGAARYDGTTWTTYNPASGFPGNDVLSIAHDAQRDEMWFGVRDGGVARYDGNDFTVINTQNGLINDRPYAILPASNGDLWVGTDFGVSQFRTPEATNSPDITGDGVVNVFDLLELLAQWGRCATPANCPADLNGDETVNVFDLLILLANWG